MSDSGFDLSKLAVGDEVGIEQRWWDEEVSQVVVLITAVDEDGFEADGDRFGRDGQSARHPGKRRLVAPTDEGRIVALCEGIEVDLKWPASPQKPALCGGPARSRAAKP